MTRTIATKPAARHRVPNATAARLDKMPPGIEITAQKEELLAEKNGGIA